MGVGRERETDQAKILRTCGKLVLNLMTRTLLGRYCELVVGAYVNMLLSNLKQRMSESSRWNEGGVGCLKAAKAVIAKDNRPSFTCLFHWDAGYLRWAVEFLIGRRRINIVVPRHAVRELNTCINCVSSTNTRSSSSAGGPVLLCCREQAWSSGQRCCLALVGTAQLGPPRPEGIDSKGITPCTSREALALSQQTDL